MTDANRDDNLERLGALQKGVLAHIDNIFDYHPPTGKPDIITAHECVRATMKEVAKTVVEMCPPGRERSLALTKLEEAMMWANAGIARNHELAQLVLDLLKGEESQ